MCVAVGRRMGVAVGIHMSAALMTRIVCDCDTACTSYGIHPHICMHNANTNTLVTRVVCDCDTTRRSYGIHPHVYICVGVFRGRLLV